MANISDFECSFYGDKKQLDKLEEEFKTNSESGWFFMESQETVPDDDSATVVKWGWSGVSDPSIDRLDDGQLSFSGQGRWHGPYSTIKFLVKKYGVTATYNDLEEGCDFYHRMEFRNGECTLDQEYDYLSKESVEKFDLEYFRDNYEWIWDEEDGFEDNIDLITTLLDLKVYTSDDFSKEEYKAIKKNREKKEITSQTNKEQKELYPNDNNSNI